MLIRKGLFRIYIYFSYKEVVTHCLHHWKDTETRGDGDDQGAGILQGLILLGLDFTQERLQRLTWTAI